MTAAAPRRRLSERRPPEPAAEPSRHPEPANPAVPTGDKIAAAVWDEYTPDFPGLIKGKVDLVDELEQILRGDFGDHAPAVRKVEVDPLDPAANAAILAGHFAPAGTRPAAEPARPVVAEAATAEPPVTRPRARGLTPASAVSPRRATRLPATAASFNLTEVEDPCEEPTATAVVAPSAFWKVGDRIPIEQPAPARVRGGIRSDIVIILVLALLIAGGGAYSAFRDWGATAPDTAGTEVARADIGALGTVGQTTTPEVAATPGEVLATAPAPLLGEMPLPGEVVTPAAPALAEAPRVPQELPQGTRTVDTLTIPIGTQIANTGTPAATAPAATQPTAPAANDPVLAYAPTQPPAATPFDEAASLAAQPRPQQQAAVPPRNQAAAPPRNPNPAGGMVAATARTWVNMRAGPDNGAAVITVVEAGARVNVVACNFWCEVVYNGQTGWIYQDFLNGAPR